MEIIVITYSKNISASIYWRLILPFNFLKQYSSLNIKFIDIDQTKKELETQSPDLVVFHSSYFCFGLINELNKRKIKYVVDFDDYWYYPKDHPQYGNKIKIELLQITKNITCSNLKLFDEFVRLKKNVCYLPNAFSFRCNNFPESENFIYGKIKIGYMAGSNHSDDISVLRGLIPVLAEKNDNFIFKLYGYTKGSEHDNYLNILTDNSDRYHNFIQLIGPASAESYLHNIQTSNIYIAPLTDNNFNKYKSELKIIESGFFRRPVICSDVYPYNLHPVRKAKKFDGFVKNILNFLNNQELIINEGNQLYNYVSKKFALETVFDERLNFLKNIK